MSPLFLAVVAGCHGPASSSDDHPGSADKDAPTITITSPVDGLGAYASDVDVTWEVTGLTLDADGIGGPKQAGHGHVNVYLDGNLTLETADLGTTLDGLAAGAHTVEVRLAENDEDELSATDTIDLPIALPTVEITSPFDNAALDASSTPVTFTINGFTMGTALSGGEDAFDEGHFRVSVDGQVRDKGIDPLHAVASGLTEGDHTIRVDLVTNTGVELDPPVYAESKVTVNPGAVGVYFARDAFDAPYDSATIPIDISSTGITLVPPSNGLPNVAGEGHYQIYLDGVYLEGSVAPSRVLQNLPAGDHVFEVRLAGNDNIETPLLDRLWVTITNGRPDALITHPGARWVMTSPFELDFQVENFTIDEGAMDGDNVAHTGHMAVFLDGALVKETGSLAVPMNGVSVGSHLVRVSLANNDRSLLDPPVYSEIEVVVQ